MLRGLWAIWTKKGTQTQRREGEEENGLGTGSAHSPGVLPAVDMDLLGLTACPQAQPCLLFNRTLLSAALALCSLSYRYRHMTQVPALPQGVATQIGTLCLVPRQSPEL